jgi:hypothetical protein
MRSKKNRVFVYILTGIIFLSPGYGAGNDKLAQSGCQFLSVVSDARAAAMGEAMTSLQIGSSALFFNPAGMSEQSGILDVTASSNRWIADITHNTLSLGLSPFEGRYGVLGLSIQSVDYGEFYGTRVDKDPGNPLAYVETGTFELSALALGLGYAKRLTDRFSVGGQVRLVKQDLGWSVIPKIVTIVDSTGTIVDKDTIPEMVSNNLRPLAFDFGTQYKTGFKSLVFGMSVRNFSKEIKYVEEGFQLPLVFNLGISMDLMDFMEDLSGDHSLYLSIDASHYRSHPEQIKVGLDYRIRKTLSLRGGYISNNYESGFTFGAGISYSKTSFDFAYTPFGLFGTVQRMTARFSL